MLHLLLVLSTLSPADSAIALASRALAAGNAWEATRLLAPVLAQPARRTPEVLLLAAQAAASWRGWSTVTRLLAGEGWLDRASSGLAKALLARAAVELGDPAAVPLAEEAVRAAPGGRGRAWRQVTLARALDRAEALDSAARTYLAATVAFPEIGDWLRLRAAGVTADSGARVALFDQVATPAARLRVRWTEALARDRTGDPAGAAQRYDTLGARLSAARLRLVAAADAGARASARDELVALLGTNLSAVDARTVIRLLDSAFTPLTRPEELAVARRAAGADLTDRAVRGFSRAMRTARLLDDDRLTYGTALAGLGRHRDAIRQFEAVRDPELRPRARYQRARSLFRIGAAAEGRAALRQVRNASPEDPATAAAAGFLLADAWLDEGSDSLARLAFAEVGRRFPNTTHGERAAFQAALLTLLNGETRTAAARYDSIADRPAPGSERTAAMYWSGRAWLAAGDTARATARWEWLLANAPGSYYVVPAARRLGRRPWQDATARDTAASGPFDPAALDRAALLDSLGMSTEARFERQQFARLSDQPPAVLVGAARTAADRGDIVSGFRLAQRALDRGVAADPPMLRLLYPIPARTVLEAEAAATGLPAYLVAAVVRQESGFDPMARSAADARGLMQVLPSVGATIARAERFPEWDPVLLYQPDVNLAIGIRHLATRLRRVNGSTEVALASYNAGPTPTSRWLRLRGTHDPEVFVERIPFVETRDYVRRVLYNWERYATLYGPAETGPGGR